MAALEHADDLATTVRLYAAGSLEAALTDIAHAFTAARGIRVQADFGPSGLLRRRLESGKAEAGGVFASADLVNPLALERAGKAGPVVLFARNRLCALARPGLAVTSEALLDVLLDPAIKLATSTPGTDPSGAYAWEVFRKAEALRPGSRASLEAKALMLTGAPDSARPPDGLSAYAWHLRAGRADLFLTYRTNARVVLRDVPAATAVDLPPALATEAEYGLTVLEGAGDPGPAAALALFLLSSPAQRVLATHGFAAPLLPRDAPR